MTKETQRGDTMVNGLDTMMDSIKSELTRLDSMKTTGNENIEIQKNNVGASQEKLKEAHEMMGRFEQKTEMCWKLQSALEEFGAGLESLKAT